MRRCESLTDLRREFANIQSGCAGDTLWMAKASLFLIEVILERLPKAKRKGRVTAWQKFMAAHARQGLSLQEIAARWRPQKHLKLARPA